MSTQDDVEQFAALLRRLKDRTDRSYGSLARRVNMNTSTLHRYCAGEAVPQDFAPVERLAAFCAATPEERLELHRLWLLAVAARQRVRTAAAAGEEPADQAPAAAEEPVDRTSAPVEEAVVPEVVEGPRPSPVVRPWYRRRRVLASTAATCALLATLGGLSALSTDHSRDTAAPRSPSGPGTTAPPSPRSSSKTKPSANSSPSTAGGSSAPGTKNRAAGSSAPGTDPTGAGKPATGLPLTWTTDSQIWDGGCAHDYVIGKEPDQVPPPPVPQDAAGWAATQGAVHGRQTMVQISVQGKSSTAVVLEALRVRVVSRGTPLKGTTYDMAQGCGGGLGPRYFDVNLDINRPIARAVSGADDRGNPAPAVKFPYRVSAQDPEVLLATATTEMYDCAWYLELDWSSQGRTGTVRIDDHGRPFRTSSIKGLPRYWYGTNGHGVRQWVPAEVPDRP
ncbi:MULTISPECIES: helix-turn-helix domain-containing protein [unclassified Streptomyces]|uniref:helix-turn-helix domain-containing protein n=1 Tax=unclassified Streptomyces TaxID=2593676 RepID=UPI0022539E87|nr:MULTISPECIES: transcriptional regulator [unclassified Streptomyces]MCX5051946.1 helix-turn-helix domain-containing protein [Streptomyces sp. NBC_00474]MCX5249841.1 helix-turn-helix domain-containing protein [Streptomyces sp. NBC_00201]